jgi:Glycosyltransferase
MTIAFYCPHSLEPWTSRNLKSGIGGSEAAVIHLSREFATLGHSVRIYNSVKAPETLEGVEWLPADTPIDPVDLLIVWRYPAAIQEELKGVQATKKVLWMHDMTPEKELLPYMYLYEQIVVQSAFHRAFYPAIPDERISIQPSGIDLGLVEGTFKRDPWKIVYCSNYDRGLLVLLENWTQLKLSFPRLQLYVLYGWNTMDALAARGDARVQAEYKHFKQYVEDLFDQKGIHHLGRRSHKELLRHLEEAQVLAYPCIYPETLCLTVLQAQAAGAVPVVVPSGALAETVKSGFITKPAVSQQEYLELLAHALQNPDEVAAEREKGAKLMREQYGWPTIAGQWLSLVESL